MPTPPLTLWNHLFRPGQRIAVAVSGGKDSVTLLDALGSPDLSLAGARFARHTLARPVAELSPLYPKR